MNLALAHFYLRDMQKARQFGRRAVEISHHGLFQRNNVALYEVYAGEYDAGAKEASSILTENAAYADAYSALAMAQVGKDQPDEAAKTYAKLRELSPRGASMSAIGMADLAMYRGRLSDAISVLTQGAAADLASQEKELAGVKLVTLADAYWDAGKQAEAINTAGKAIALNKTEHVLFRAGRIFALAKDRKRSAEVISELSGRVGSEPRSYAKLVDGELLLAQGNAKEAVNSFLEAQKLADTWLSRFSLGRGYLQAEMFTEAYAEFEQCLKRKGEATAVFLDDVPSFRVLPELHYMIGRAQAGLNSPAAADSFRTVLAMQPSGEARWIADARRRLNTQ
jgi:tetratricopeptide (TPR) repeat protein